MKKVKFIAILCFVLVLCGCVNKQETIELYGRESTVLDNTTIKAPVGFFVNRYKWVNIDDNTKQLVITLTNDKALGEE